MQLDAARQGHAREQLHDGIMARARDDAARLVRTQTTNAVSEARVAVAERNAARVYAGSTSQSLIVA